MHLFKLSKDLQEFIQKKKAEGKKIGFVPTMGALHSGHLSLIAEAKEESDLVVCSIFVNPTQFNDKKDLEKYPRPIEHDMQLLLECDCDVLFLPSENEMYPEGTAHLKYYDLGYLDKVLEAAFRPGHFQGVANIVFRLLNSVNPDFLLLGKKDFQQVLVIKRMIEIENLPVKIMSVKTLRESSGLAMSSRNVRLSEKAWDNASKISAILFSIRDLKNNFNSISVMRKEAVKQLKEIPDSILEYFDICDAETLVPLTIFIKEKPAVMVVAIWIDGVRLIDNVEL